MKLSPLDLVKNKKAQIGKRINAILLVIISVIILFSIFDALVPEAQSAGTQLGDAQRCSDGGGFFNTSQSACLNGTNPGDTGVVAFSAIPISTLFSSSGVIILLLMVSLILIVIKMVMPRGK